MALFSVRSLFLQVSKTWFTDCTSLHSLHKGSFVLVFLKLLSWLSSVQLASIRILVNILLTLAERNCHKLVYFKEDLTRNIMCLYSSEIRQLSYT